MPVAVSDDMSILSLIGNASLLVQLVMLSLLGLSLISWWYIFLKREIFKDALKCSYVRAIFILDG